MKVSSSLLPGLLALLPATLVEADRTTAFNIQSVSCSTNSATITSASCGMGDADACEMGDRIDIAGTYTVSTMVPTEVEICGKIKVYGVQVYNAGCDNVNVCDYLDCSGLDDEEYLSISDTPYSFEFDNIQIPGNSRWIGSGYGFGFVFDATGYNGASLETCRVVVSTTSISTSAGIAAVASLCAVAALYYRKKRRTGTIDLEKEESLVQTDFVEMSKTGVSV